MRVDFHKVRVELKSYLDSEFKGYGGIENREALALPIISHNRHCNNHNNVYYNHLHDMLEVLQVKPLNPLNSSRCYRC